MSTHSFHWIHTYTDKIKDEHLLGLIAEIAEIRGEKFDKGTMIIHFLTGSLHPKGALKKKSIKKKELLLAVYLLMSMKDFQQKAEYDEINKLCIDLIVFSQIGAIEDFLGTKLYVLLNKAIPDNSKKKKKIQTSKDDFYY